MIASLRPCWTLMSISSRHSAAVVAGNHRPRYISFRSTNKETYKNELILNCTQHELFKIVSDVHQYHHFIPWCVGSRIFPETLKLQRGPCSVPQAGGQIVEHSQMKAELVVGFKSFEERYTSIVTTEDLWKVTARALDGSTFKELKTTWTIIPLPAKQQGIKHHRSLVKFDIEFEFKSMLYAAVSKSCI